jgi:CRP-like cAMP-binding protein
MEKYDALQRSPLFEMLSPAELELVAEMSRPRKFAAGEVVFEEGEVGDSLFVVASGAVDVLRRNDSGELKVINTFEAPHFVGEMALIDKEQRSATVRARADTVLLQLTAQNFAAFRKHHRDGFTFVVMNIARALSSRLREANDKLSARL